MPGISKFTNDELASILAANIRAEAEEVNRLRRALQSIADFADDPECDDLDDVAIMCIATAKNALDARCS